MGDARARRGAYAGGSGNGLRDDLHGGGGRERGGDPDTGHRRSAGGPSGFGAEPRRSRPVFASEGARGECAGERVVPAARDRADGGGEQSRGDEGGGRERRAI